MACKECGGNGGHHKPGCGMSPAALQINNKDCTLFHSVTIPAIMGDETENPPTNGLYKNVLLYYEASGNAYFYSSDGIPTKLTYATTDYNALTNKPTINGVTLEGNQSSSSLGININDATLTIKQGDTTLGTFSANASENVEINISNDEAVRLRVGWTGGSQPENWEVQTEDGVIYFYNYNIASPGHASIVEFQITDASFTNEETEESLTADQVFNLLETGNKVILDNVPLGARYPYDSSDTIFSTVTVDNIELSAKETDRFADGDTPLISYTGGAYISGADSGVATYLGARLMSDGDSVCFYVQGRGHYYNDAQPK